VTLALHWFRNDLRRRDNTALSQAAREAERLGVRVRTAGAAQ